VCLTATQPLSVSEYAFAILRALRQVGPAEIEGEVQGPRRSGSGMLWFTLSDGESALSCKVFVSDLRRLQHLPRDGDLVVVRVDRPDLYTRTGKLDLIVSEIRLAGEGELLRRRQELIERLAAEGLCERSRWRPLPRFPRAVGVIAGRQSDGLADVVRALRDRWPAVDIVVCPALVQGVEAPRDIIDAIARLEEHPRVDVVVIARGGGSVQDLACFDDERLCRAIFASRLPIVCAVGHTENNPVCNHVTWAAFTPSRSAEMVVPSRAELRREIEYAAAALQRATRRLDGLQAELAAIGRRLKAAAVLERPLQLLRSAAGPLQRAGATLQAKGDQVCGEGLRIQRAARRQLADHRRDYLRAGERLVGTAARAVSRRLNGLAGGVRALGEALPARARRALLRWQREVSYTAGLISARDLRSHGWALLHHNDRPIRSARALAAGLELDITLHDGRARARVTGSSEEGAADGPDKRAKERSDGQAS